MAIEIPVYDHGVPSAHALVDEGDAERVLARRWRLEGGYARTGKQGLGMHRFILRPPGDKEVDHIDHNRLNNQRSNLRVCTHQVNTQNMRNRTGGTRGVYFDSTRQKWMAHIKVDGVRIYKRFDMWCHAMRHAAALRDEYFGRIN
jgi:hypothetical protein